MPQGGARAHSGRLPDPTAIRNDRGGTASWTTLPARRDGPVPEWPLSPVRDYESETWTEAWAMPQAIMWEANQQHREVALFVRTFTRAADPDCNPALLTAVRQQMDNLGLSAGGMLRLRWRISPDEPAKPEVKRANGSRSTAARSRFKTLPGGVA